MADSAPEADLPGARVDKDAIDPELVKLARSRVKIGLVTSAGMVFLSVFFLIKLNPDRRFAGSGEAQPVNVADVLAGKVDRDSHVTIDAEPLFSHAIREFPSKGSLGRRIVPVRGSNEHLWIALSGDGFDPPTKGGYTGRLRKMSDLAFASYVDDFAAAHPRPLFATAALVRAGFATGKVTTVTGEQIAISDGDTVAFEIVDPNAATVIGAFGGKLATADAWSKALADAQIATTGQPQATKDVVRFDVVEPDAVAHTSAKLEAAKLWRGRVEPVTRHYETTWGALRASPPAGFAAGGKTIPDAQLDLVGLYVSRGIPSDAYALITGEEPGDYWYVLPVSIGLAAIGLVFLWAFVRTARRDLFPAPAA